MLYPASYTHREEVDITKHTYIASYIASYMVTGQMQSALHNCYHIM